MARKLLYPALTLVPVVVAAPVDVSFVQASESVPYQQTFLYQSIADPVQTVSAPETVTVDKWLQQFEVPSRQSIRPRDLVALIPDNIAQFWWQQPLSIPSRIARLPLPEFGAVPVVITAPEVVTSDKWFNPFSVPIQRKVNLPEKAEAFLPLVSAPAPETITVDKWYRDFGIPTYRLSYSAALSPVFSFQLSQPEAITVDKWYREFGTPVYRLSYSAALSPVSFQSIYLATAPEVVTADKWFVSFEQIIRARRLLAAQQQAYANPALTPAPPPPAPPLDGWSYEWSGPVRLNVLAVANQLEAVAPVIPQPNPDPPAPTGVYTVSGQYVIDQFTDNTVVYDYGGGVSRRTN